MKRQKRAYQKRAVDRVRELWSQGVMSVLVVSPPGSGKTEMGMDSLGDGVVVWVTHTRELAIQAYHRLQERFGRDAVSMVMAGYHENPGARIHVGTVHSILKRGKKFRNVETVVLDEAHHYLAETWMDVRLTYSGPRGGRQKVRELGLTATPERDDGKPMGDIFQELVVAASYSELLKSGHIVPVRVFAPERDLGSDYAKHPVDAWAEYSEGSLTFAFFPRVHIASMYGEQWIARGVPTDVITAVSSSGSRQESLSDFKNGRCRVLSTVNTMTEGINIDEARTALIARSYDFIGGWLQSTGRVLRPFDGKEDSIIIDLTGASLRHGSPTQDREYSLTGKAISGPSHGGGGGGVVSDPSVVGVNMVMLHRGALKPGAKIVSVDLPDPDPNRVRLYAKDKASIRRAHTKHGEAGRRQIEAAIANRRGRDVRA